MTHTVTIRRRGTASIFFADCSCGEFRTSESWRLRDVQMDKNHHEAILRSKGDKSEVIYEMDI